MIPFKISEFCITDDAIPVDIADKILKYHIEPILKFRELKGFPIWASQKSGYRPYAYELKNKRSGNSQHCFKGKGAVDWTCSKENIPVLLQWLKTFSPYKRVCYYPNNNFIHCDYLDTKSGNREYYECESQTSKWKYKNRLI